MTEIMEKLRQSRHDSYEIDWLKQYANEHQDAGWFLEYSTGSYRVYVLTDFGDKVEVAIGDGETIEAAIQEIRNKIG